MLEIGLKLEQIVYQELKRSTEQFEKYVFIGDIFMIWLEKSYVTFIRNEHWYTVFMHPEHQMHWPQGIQLGDLFPAS